MTLGGDGTRRTTFRALLAEVKTLLAAGLRLPKEKIFVLDRALGQQTNIRSMQFVVLRPGGAKVDGQWHDSEGRLCVAVERELIIEPHLQQSLDSVVEMDRITDSLLDLEDQVVDIVDIYEPQDALEPIHFLGISPEQGGEEVPSESRTPCWAKSSMRFSVKFLQAVNQSRQ
jgi:hypothetical protein